MTTLDVHLPPINVPVILTDPYKGSHVLRWTKSRGTADTGPRATMSREASFAMEEDDTWSSSTPYRLPRLSPGRSPSPEIEQAHVREERKSPPHDKVWSRHGYEKIIRIPELGPQVRMLVAPARTPVGGQYPRATPRFKQAAITPTVRSVPWNVGRGDTHHIHLYDTVRTPRMHDDDVMHQPRLEPTPTPISRSESPAKSVKSIHWILGHNRYHTFDKTGRSHIQGPYSREFHVTCMAPQTWLKMKWGRSKTMIH
ncbi:uncharacterized protein LOC128240076 isoform X2 [Mya arenaria]|uniref:uncharacterized protein LOC128240076 isoform X2 n=1 Tax=Mya arenaria TaxID=6604 RepID=UPI0022E5EB02|nr:uncharacterized protein LOC128240076 isoform X2 [Mya arenaria]